MNNRTFTMIKPDAVGNNYIGPILAKINEAGFRIAALKYTRLSQERAGEFYEVHKERPFYKDLVSYMSSGPIVAAILEKDNAVEDFRKLIGATDPSKAEKGTIRNLFAKSIEANAVTAPTAMRMQPMKEVFSSLERKSFNDAFGEVCAVT